MHLPCTTHYICIFYNKIRLHEEDELLHWHKEDLAERRLKMAKIPKEIILFLPLIQAIITAENSIYSVKEKTSIDGSSAVLGTSLRRMNCTTAEYQATNKQCKLHGDSPQHGTTDTVQTKAITLLGSCPFTHAQNSAQGSYLLKEYSLLFLITVSI